MKIRTKFVLYFTSAMIFFAMIIGVVFVFTYQSQNETAVTDKLIKESNFLEVSEILKKQNIKHTII